MIRTKSFVTSSSNPLDPSQSLPERVGSGEIVLDACGERDVRHKKRHGDGGFDACIVCEVSDVSVSRCSGMDCPLWFHEECLTPEFGGNEDLSNPFCPYCWYKIVRTKSDILKEKVIEAEMAVLKFLDIEKKSSESVSEKSFGEQVLQGEKAADSLKEEQEVNKEKLETGTGEARDMAGENVNDVLNLLDDEDDEERAQVSTCAVKIGDVLRLLSIQESSSGQEHNKVLQTEKQRRRTQVINLSDIDDEVSSSTERNEEDVTEHIGSSLSKETNEEDVTEQISSSLSRELNEEDVTEQIGSSLSRELNEEDVTEQIGSSLSTETNVTELIDSSSSKEANNQQSKLKAANIETTTSKPLRTLPPPSSDVAFFNKNERRRVLWTPEEKKMLMVGVETFAAEAKKNIPWRKILELGSKVFHESRTSSDLKDKWRNMRKAAALALP